MLQYNYGIQETLLFAIAEGLRDAFVSRNLATTNHPI